MKKYKVMAVMTSYVYLTVEAESKEEAFDIADETDGGDFTEEDCSWTINADRIEEIEEDK